MNGLAPNLSDGDQHASNIRIPASFEALYDAHYAFVRRTVRRLGVSVDAAEDVCQEAFVVIYRRLGDFEGRSALRTWIYRIVANTVLNQRRTQLRKSPHTRPGALVEPDLVAISGPGPERRAETAEAAQLARDILMAMSEDRRMAFVLVELEGMSYAEAGAALEHTVDTVRARVRAARDEFSRQVRRINGLGSGVAHV